MLVVPVTPWVTTSRFFALGDFQAGMNRRPSGGDVAGQARVGEDPRVDQVVDEPWVPGRVMS